MFVPTLSAALEATPIDSAKVSPDPRVQRPVDKILLHSDLGPCAAITAVPEKRKAVSPTTNETTTSIPATPPAGDLKHARENHLPPPFPSGAQNPDG